MTDFDETVGPSASERAKAHAASDNGAGREVQAYEAGKRARAHPEREPRQATPTARVQVDPGGSPWKVLILAEMLTLLGAGLMLNRDPTDPWLVTLLTKGGAKRVIAVSVLLVLLMLMADLGVGGLAALIGGLVLISYLTAHGASGGQFLQFERGVLGQ